MTAPPALRWYERARSERTAMVQRRSRRDGDLIQLPNGRKQRVHDMVQRRFTIDKLDWLYGCHADEKPSAGTQGSPA